MEWARARRALIARTATVAPCARAYVELRHMQLGGGWHTPPTQVAKPLGSAGFAHTWKLALSACAERRFYRPRRGRPPPHPMGGE